MRELLLNISANIQISDVLDIAIVTFVIYKIMEFIKETKKTSQESELRQFIADNLNVEVSNNAVESILLTAWKNTRGNTKIDYTLNMNALNELKEKIKIIIKEREELVLWTKLNYTHI